MTTTINPGDKELIKADFSKAREILKDISETWNLYEGVRSNQFNVKVVELNRFSYGDSPFAIAYLNLKKSTEVLTSSKFTELEQKARRYSSGVVETPNWLNPTIVIANQFSDNVLTYFMAITNGLNRLLEHEEIYPKLKIQLLASSPPEYVARYLGQI